MFQGVRDIPANPTADTNGVPSPLDHPCLNDLLSYGATDSEILSYSWYGVSNSSKSIDY